MPVGGEELDADLWTGLLKVGQDAGGEVEHESSSLSGRLQALQDHAGPGPRAVGIQRPSEVAPADPQAPGDLVLLVDVGVEPGQGPVTLLGIFKLHIDDRVQRPDKVHESPGLNGSGLFAAERRAAAAGRRRLPGQRVNCSLGLHASRCRAGELLAGASRRGPLLWFNDVWDEEDHHLALAAFGFFPAEEAAHQGKLAQERQALLYRLL